MPLNGQYGLWDQINARNNNPGWGGTPYGTYGPSSSSQAGSWATPGNASGQFWPDGTPVNPGQGITPGHNGTAAQYPNQSMSDGQPTQQYGGWDTQPQQYSGWNQQPQWGSNGSMTQSGYGGGGYGGGGGYAPGIPGNGYQQGMMGSSTSGGGQGGMNYGYGNMPGTAGGGGYNWNVPGQGYGGYGGR